MRALVVLVLLAACGPRGDDSPATRADLARRGEQIARDTRAILPDHVGADLSCANCHLGAGTVAGAGPWRGLPGLFPMYRARTGKMDTLPERINDCFARSLNGTPIPEDGPEMRALLAWMDEISVGVPAGTEPPGRGFPPIEPAPTPNPEAGAAIFAARCAACHGGDGAGRRAPDGAVQFPPLWGSRSFNLGAGMARLDTAAAFVQANMPLGAGGSLTDQEAYDVAAWFIYQDRPDFPGKATDWPNGGKPRDARY